LFLYDDDSAEGFLDRGGQTVEGESRLGDLATELS
jgi:hypothetical protein